MSPLQAQWSWPWLLALLLPAIAPGAATDGATMQALIAGGGRIRVQTLPRPTAAAGEVLVAIRFAGVNPDDWKHASGHGEGAEQADSSAAVESAADGAAIPGLDGAGVVAALGAGVTGLAVGEPVIVYSPRRGTYAQYVAVPDADVVPKPETMSYEQAAGLAHAGLTAWNLLVEVAHVHAGQNVLVLGGAGGVGSAAVQIAHDSGAHVLATASARNADYLRSIGAEQVIDYTRAHFEDQVGHLDIVVNTVDADNAFRGLAVVRPGGVLVSVNGLPPPAQCAARAVTCSYRTRAAAPVSTALRQFAAWSRRGRYRVNIDRVFGQTQVMAAWSYSQAGHTRGKSVIRIDE